MFVLYLQLLKCFVFVITVGVKKSSSFPIVVHSKNALSIAVLFPFCRTRHKRRTAVPRSYRFYGVSVSFIHFCLNGHTTPVLWSDDRLNLAYYSEV